MSANNAIGTGAIVLTASADGVARGLQTATGHLSKWAKSAPQVAGSALGGKGLFASMIGGAVGGGSLGGIGAGIGLAVGGPVGAAIGAAIGSGISGAVASFGQLSASADAASKSARSLGMPTEELMGLQHAADLSGISAEQLGKAFGFLRKQSTGDFNTVLAQTADRIAGISDPGQKAAAAVEAFGRGGLALLPMLEGGSAGLNEMVSEAKRLGITLNDVEAGKLEEANDAVTRAGSAFEGMKRKLLVAVAPMVELIGGGLAKAFEYLQPLIRWVGEAADTYFTVWSAILGEVWTVLKDVAVGVARWVGELLGLDKITWTVRGTMMAAFRGIGIGVAYVWDTLKAGAGAISFIASFWVDGFALVLKALKNVVDLAKELPDSVRPDWVGDLADNLDGASKRAGDIAEQMRKWGEGSVKGFGKSADDVKKWFDNLEKRMGQAPAAKRARALAGDMPDVDDGSKGPQLSGAFQKGSKEAYTITTRFQMEGMNRQQDWGRQQVHWLQRITEEVKRLGRKKEAELGDVFEGAI